MRSCNLLVGLVTWVAITTYATKLCDKKCFPGQPCWPSDEAIANFAYSLEGDFVHPSDPSYATLNTMKNGRVKKVPAAIVFVKSINDVKKCIEFAKRFKIRVTILSTGHSYTGRSAHDGSLLINMSNMTNMDVRTDPTVRSPGGEITVETGNTWARVYEEVDKYGRVVVGGSAHTVGMGGYTQGGGHSPMSRSLGLAVDNLLEVKLVTADGHLLTTSSEGTYNEDTKTTSAETDLFWALRGGGGGTWGVVISFTFKLHVPPPQFVRFVSFYPLVVNDTTPGLAALESAVRHLAQLPKEWGGYTVIDTTPQANSPGVIGSIVLSLLHYGPWNSTSREAIQPLMADPNSVYVTLQNKTSFWDYEKDVIDADLSDYRIYTVNALTPPTVDAAKLSKTVIDGSFAGITPTSGTGCTFTMLGGKMQEAAEHATPINPGFRSSLFSVSCGRAWVDPTEDQYHLNYAHDFNSKLIQLGNGVYFNEPAEVLPTWKTDFWGRGGNYDKLLQIKRKWDRDNFFCCQNCVGSDLDDTWGMYPSSGVLKVVPGIFFTVSFWLVTLF